MGISPVPGERSMSDTPSHGPVKSIMPKWVRGPQDFVGGIALMAIALFALWASSDLQGMHGFSFGVGNPVDGNHHRRDLFDDRLQSAFPLCAGAATAALPAFSRPVRA